MESWHKVHPQDEQTVATGELCAHSSQLCASVATWAIHEPDTPIPFQSHRGEPATSGCCTSALGMS